jgi:hypothetical protein
MENYIFGIGVFNYIHWGYFRAPGWSRRDGLQRMGLDDDFSIRNVLPFRDAHIAWAYALRLPWFIMLKMLQVGSYDVFTLIAAFSVCLRMEEWVDGKGWVWMTFQDWAWIFFF